MVGLWWLLLAVAIVFAIAWGVLHGVIVPRIGEMRPRLENHLTQALGVPVRIGSITAQSNTMVPSFELQDVRLLDAAGRDALVLKTVTAALSPRSLVQLGFEQLVIDQPTLDIRRDTRGHIWVAGLDMSTPVKTADSQAATDWFFSQREFVIRSGTVRWTDELRNAAPLTLNQVDWVLRNPGRQHNFRLDATPMADWGDRFSVVGQMQTPLLQANAGPWYQWDGDVYADFSRMDVSQLKRYADLGIDITQGAGALRAWAQWSQGQVVKLSADVALNQVNVRLAKDLAPIAMHYVSGRISGESIAGGIRVATEGLNFQTQDGIRWPGGNVSFLQTGQDAKTPALGELKADKLDLAALAQIADRLPIGTATHNLIRGLAPKGLVTTMQATWQGPISAPTRYEAQGQVQGLSVAAQHATTTLATSAAAGTTTAATHPGLRGANVDFKLNQSGGQAQLDIVNGALDLPNVFEDSVVLLNTLTSRIKWTLEGEKIDLQLDQVKFANADAQGEIKVHWHTADPIKSKGKSRFPGVLDLQGSLSRADGTKVYRYLPLVIAKPAREYVRQAVVQGRVTSGKFKVKGDLHEMPFVDPKLGDFNITAQVADTYFAYVPPSLQPAGSLPWPALTQLSGELVFDRASMAVNSASGRIGEQGTVQLTKADARIPDLARSTTVVVSANANGPLAEMLAVVNNSPLLEITNKSLTEAKATGNAGLKLQLNLPISALGNSKVAGSVTLAGNDVQITPSSPPLGNAKAIVSFNETGFSIKDAQASMLGGEVRVEGGTRPGAGPADASIVVKAQGTVSAEGLRQAKELGFASRLGQHASGSASYAATLGFRRGVPELAFTSNLQGLALNLPEPLRKNADATLNIRYDNSLVRESLGAGQKLQDTIALDLGSIASVGFTRDISGKEPRVLRGSIGVGLADGESAPAMETGVGANINFAQINVDAWQKIFATLTINDAAGTSTLPVASAEATASQYLPTVIGLRARELIVDGRTLGNVVVGGSREGLTWRANLDARELNGYLEYRQASSANAGLVYARLTRLNIAPSTAAEIETKLIDQPSAIPALDIVVDDMELLGKKLGRVEIEAVNRGQAAAASDGAVREWRLNKLNISTPEAQFTATGNWAALANSDGSRPKDRRRTVMNFKLDIADSGELLKRFGMDKTIAKGKGKMEGLIGWAGSPLSLDYPSMSGNFNVNIESGQFLQKDPGLAKLLGILSLQALPRRLTLDFRDVFSEGFSFDFVRGDIKIDQGIAKTNNLQMKGVNAAVLLEGSSDLAKGTQDIRAVIVPEINAGTASLVAAVINPAIGLGTFLAQLILRRPLIEAATNEYRIEGTWGEPKYTKIERKAPAATTPTNNDTP
jgi:uncharacterized protein (TIGR02099 family)